MRIYGIIGFLVFGYLAYQFAYYSETLLYASMTLIGISVFIVANTIFVEEEQFKAQEKLDESQERISNKKLDGVLKYSRPFFKRYVSPIVSSMKNKNKIKDAYKRKLASAGLTNILTPYDFYSFKLFLIVGFPILYTILKFFLEFDYSMWYVLPVSVLGYFYPNIWLNGKIERRQKDIILFMPFVVDMLALSVEAGLDFIAAMSKVIEKAPATALTEELEILIKEVKVGASRAEALRNFSWRADLIPISSFTATLIAADSVGASIGPILKQLSTEIRQKRSAEAEKEGAKAATKILFPMMFFIIPSVFIIIGAPIALELIGGKK